MKIEMKNLEKKLNKIFFAEKKTIDYYSNSEHENAIKISENGQTWSIGDIKYIIDNKHLYEMFKYEIDSIFLKNIWDFVSKNYSFSSTADLKRVSIWKTQYIIHQRTHEFVGKIYQGTYEEIKKEYRAVNPDNNDIWVDIRKHLNIYAEKIYCHKFMDVSGSILKPDTIIYKGRIFSYDNWGKKMILPEVKRKTASSWNEVQAKIINEITPIYFTANNWKWNDDLFIPDSIECETPVESGYITTCLVG